MVPWTKAVARPERFIRLKMKQIISINWRCDLTGFSTGRLPASLAAAC